MSREMSNIDTQHERNTSVPERRLQLPSCETELSGAPPLFLWHNPVDQEKRRETQDVGPRCAGRKVGEVKGSLPESEGGRGQR